MFAISPPPNAAATNSMATNNRPLPRNTVPKKRSSRWPIRSLSTPMNHKKAIPANGMRFSAIATAARRRESVSHEPGTAGSAGTETLSNTSATSRNTEKMIPATAAARGVLNGLPARSGPGLSASSVIGHSFRGTLLPAQRIRRPAAYVLTRTG